MKINHLGIAVKSLEEALAVYRDLFPGLVVEMEPQQEGAVMQMAMLHTENGTLLELMEPLIQEGDVGRFIAKRGEGIHHIAYEVEDIRAAYGEMKAKGYRVLGEIHRGAGGYDTFFIHPKDVHGVLTEFVGRPAEEK